MSPPPASLRRRRTVGLFRPPQSRDAAVNHRLDPVHRLGFLLVDAGERRLEEVLVQPAVGHGAVEAADGPDAHREGLGLERPRDVAVDLWLQRRRRTQTLRLGLVEASALLCPRSLSIFCNSCWS